MAKAVDYDELVAGVPVARLFAVLMSLLTSLVTSSLEKP